jgi:SAM-dependent methyltransferase
MEWRFRVLEWHLRKNALLKAGDKYLEIGCGHGQFMHQSDARLPEITVDGCDLNLFALNKITGVRGDVFVYDIFEKKAEMLHRYAGVFLLDVIEHIDNDERFLRVAMDHVLPGGLVVINVPALSSLFSKYDTAAGHKRRYTREDMMQLFERCNLEPIYVGYWGFSLLPVAMIRKFYLKSVPPEKIIAKGFSPSYGWINKFFKTLMKLELSLSKNPAPGTSVMAIGRIRT